MAQHTKGPWRFVGKFGAGWLVDPNIAVIYGGSLTGHDVDGEANAHLITAAPLLELIADLTGRYAWEALSENFRHDLTKQRKADLLAAYRAYTGYRDGRMTMTEAWSEVSEIVKRLPELPSA